MDEKLKSQIAEIKRLTPTPRRQFDQFTATTETTINRVKLMQENGDLVRHKVIFLGDDDLTSVAAGILERSADIQVLEIDRRLVALIKDTQREKHLNIRVSECDLEKDLPREFVGRYDVVFTDPPYTPSGVGLFLNQAIMALKKDATSKIYLCFGTSDRARERELAIQQVITERGLVIRNKFHGFNHYLGAKSIGSQSSLYILDFTPKTRVVKIENKRIYTHE